MMPQRHRNLEDERGLLSLVSPARASRPSFQDRESHDLAQPLCMASRDAQPASLTGGDRKNAMAWLSRAHVGRATDRKFWANDTAAAAAALSISHASIKRSSGQHVSGQRRVRAERGGGV